MRSFGKFSPQNKVIIYPIASIELSRRDLGGEIKEQNAICHRSKDRTHCL